ncbi:MAG TPA: LD-carboxypeptidase [Thermoanaerobaculia bacterium]|nr:LD-carboxypeptidase [Thermoanaerobaculia bacterium]
MIRPAHLPPPAGPGDRVGVAALSGPVDPARLSAGVEALRRLGFEPVLADNLGSRHGFLAGTDAERLAAFHRLAADPSLTAIFFARGGYGLMRLLPALDWDLLRRHPRAYVGYSDLTPLLLGLVERLGLVSFHGPLVAAELARGLSAEEEESLLGALAGRYPVEQPFTSTLREGENGGVSGPLLGGCLSLLAATLGTPFFPDLEGSLVFWEDINEAPYKVDRMLTHLSLSGNLTNIEGMIVGHIEGAGEPGGEPAKTAEWPALVASNLSGFSWPLAWGLEIGHVAPNRTLPVGLPARLDTANGRLLLGLG